jgi:RimJ/RimL family protein N-acetyltransferase
VIFPPSLPLIHGPECTDHLAAWAAARIPQMAGGGFGPCWAVGVVRPISDKKIGLVAVCVYHDWQPHHGVVQMSIAADTPRWASRQVLAALLGVPFLGKLDPSAPPCRKVIAVCASDNPHACRFVVRAGFTQEAVLAHQFGRKQHAVVHRMFARDYARRYGGLH